jgi:aquaporin Z
MCDAVNPARSIGPALFAGPAAVGQLWLFIVVPLIGAALAAGVYAVIRADEPLIVAKAAEQAFPSEQTGRRSF